MLDVCSFSFQPRRFWALVRIGTTVNDAGHSIAKFLSDIPQPFRAAAIFRRVMQQCGDGFRFIRTVFKRDRSDAENMRDEGNPRFLAGVIAMRARRVNQRFLKFLGEVHVNWIVPKAAYIKVLSDLLRSCSGGLRPSLVRILS